MKMERKFFKRYSYVIVGFLFVSICNSILFEGDSCVILGQSGICTKQDECLKLVKAFYESRIRNEDIPRCGFTTNKEVICCPNGNLFGPSERSTLRPAAQYCLQIEQNLQPILTEHILGGLPVNIGEYPHMAAIGYRSFGNDMEPFEFNCGGSLIASKFVLTAAHCVTDPRRQPKLVLLGTVSLNETSDGVIINIAKTYPHPEYLPSSTYNDIALIEMRSDVEYSASINPICLYTNYSDPPSNADLFISGWGETEKQRHSNILLGAKVKLVSLENCNKEIAPMGFRRRLAQGVQDTQICAIDSEKDACTGDSGGPLMLVKNKDLGLYSAFGIIASGFSCGGSVPSFYTRVSAYLDFIEEIVWPNAIIS